MARNDPMTWRTNQQRWSKFQGGKYFNVSPRQLTKAGLLDADAPHTKEATRSAMRAWWSEKEAEIELANTPRPVTGVYLSKTGIEFDEDGSETEVLGIGASQFSDWGDANQLSEHIETLIDNGERRLRSLAPAPCPVDSTIKSHLTDFLRLKRNQARAGNRTASRVDILRIHLSKFSEWMGSGEPITNIGEQTVSDYYQHVLSEMEAGKIKSRYYARDMFSSFRQFVRWAAHRRSLPIPLNLDSRDFGFAVNGHGKIELFSREEIKTILENSSERTRLYILLMLNCGFYQTDISELGVSEIDLKRSVITHKRTKTADQKNVPTVDYPLWPETVELLAKSFNNTCDVKNRLGDRIALVGENGNPLRTERLDENNKLKKTDAIRNAYNRVIIKLKKSGTTINKTLKHLRKTSASTLEQHPEYGRYAVHFLGHSPRSVAAKHYITPDSKQFAAAIEWLRGELID